MNTITFHTIGHQPYISVSPSSHTLKKQFVMGDNPKYQLINIFISKSSFSWCIIITTLGPCGPLYIELPVPLPLQCAEVGQWEDNTINIPIWKVGKWEIQSHRCIAILKSFWADILKVFYSLGGSFSIILFGPPEGSLQLSYSVSCLKKCESQRIILSVKLLISSVVAIFQDWLGIFYFDSS